MGRAKLIICNLLACTRRCAHHLGDINLSKHNHRHGGSDCDANSRRTCPAAKKAKIHAQAMQEALPDSFKAECKLGLGLALRENLIPMATLRISMCTHAYILMLALTKNMDRLARFVFERFS